VARASPTVKLSRQGHHRFQKGMPEQDTGRDEKQRAEAVVKAIQADSEIWTIPYDESP
jgi:hypothetical protein